HSPVDYTIEEILYVRDLVDSHCARLAALANNETIINKIELLHFRMENSIHENNVAEFYMLDKQFHLTISEASHNRVLLDMSRMLWEQRVNIPYAGLDKRSGDKNVLIKLNQQHKAIIEAIRAGNADNALQRALLHLKYVREIIGY
ncbi:TPA: FadR/GntR family transcriptional regulator, partial [Escherichia coli]